MAYAAQETAEKEKGFTHQRDALSQQRRALPWVKVEKSYVFDTPEGKLTLADLFDERSQLIVYHFMFGPGAKWKEGCPSCSFLVDHIDGANLHRPRVTPAGQHDGVRHGPKREKSAA